MEGKGQEISIKLKAKLDKAFGGNFKAFSDKVGKLQDEAGKLAAQSEKLKKFEKNMAGMNKAGKELSRLGNESKIAKLNLSKLEEEMSKSSKVTKKMKLEHQAAVKAVEGLDKKIAGQKNTFNKYRMELQRLKIPLKDYQKELKKTERAIAQLELKQRVANKVDSFKGKVKNVAGKAVRTVAMGAMLTTAVAGAGAYSSARSYVDFNRQMLKVQAISGATEEEFKRLENEAIRLGSTTVFTASEAAAGMEKFALAGFKTKDIIAAMPGVLDLAAAFGEDFIMVADIVSDNMIPFKMSMDDTGRFADILANTMSRTNTNVGMLGEAFKYAAGDAGSLNMSLELTAAAIGLMGDQAIKSGMAGRDLKAALSKIADSGTQKNLARMGITVKDKITKEFVGMVPLIEQLEKQTAKMTGIQKVAFLKTNFGEQGALAIDKLLTAEKEFDGKVLKGSAALRALEEENKNSQGKSKQMADIMLQGASGAMVLLESAVDGLKIVIGSLIFSPEVLNGFKKVSDFISELANVLRGNYSDTPLNKTLQEMVGWITNFVERIGTALIPAKKAIDTLFPKRDLNTIGTVIDKIADRFIILVSVVSTAAEKIAPFINLLVKAVNFIGADNILIFIGAFMLLGKVLKGLAFLKGVIIGIKAVGGVFLTLKTILMALGGPVVWIGAAIALTALIYKNWNLIKKKSLELWETIKKLWVSLDNNPFGRLIKIFIKFFTPIGLLINAGIALYNNWDIVKAGAVVLGRNIWELINKYWFLLGPIGAVIKGGTWLYENWELVKKTAAVLGKSIFEMANKYWFLLGPLGLVIKAGKLLYENWELVKESIVKVTEVIGNAIDTIWDKISNFFSGIGDKIKNFPFVKKFLLDIDTEMKSKKPDGSHKTGLSYVPFDNYLATLHKGERVLTAEENEEYNLLTRLNRVTGNTIINNNSSSTTNSKETSGMSLHIENHFHISGTATQETINYAAEELEKKIKKILKELGIDERRVKFD
ncbi:phage tail tape measure protein [Fusobacterium ulcerans]|uniref:phage tail tape measure protein n=1 Tax=Fusobacterium ulcerans TaxID=861 RepID=UPI0026EAC952|nr:phage tail tape measure protein [Fusobacterium ulcerans]